MAESNGPLQLRPKYHMTLNIVDKQIEAVIFKMSVEPFVYHQVYPTTYLNTD